MGFNNRLAVIHTIIGQVHDILIKFSQALKWSSPVIYFALYLNLNLLTKDKNKLGLGPGSNGKPLPGQWLTKKKHVTLMGSTT